MRRAVEEQKEKYMEEMSEIRVHFQETRGVLTSERTSLGRYNMTSERTSLGTT